MCGVCGACLCFISGKKSRTVERITGKCNAVTIDGCSKCAVVMERYSLPFGVFGPVLTLMISSALASLDVVNCKSLEIQVNGFVPTINVDGTSDACIYVSKEVYSVYALL